MLLMVGRYVSQYVVGHKFYDQDTTLFLYQVLQVARAQSRPTTASASSDVVIDDLRPLDSGKGFVLQASIDVVDGNNQDLKEKATQQLLAMKEVLKQAVTLEPADRLSLDTRVLSRNVKP
jgi:mediator of RNA polymerase II transcription subunit 18